MTQDDATMPQWPEPDIDASLEERSRIRTQLVALHNDLSEKAKLVASAAGDVPSEAVQPVDTNRFDEIIAAARNEAARLQRDLGAQSGEIQTFASRIAEETQHIQRLDRETAELAKQLDEARASRTRTLILTAVGAVFALGLIAFGQN